MKNQTSSKTQKKVALAEPDEALNHLLENLLAEVPENIPEQVVEQVATPVEEIKLQEPLNKIEEPPIAIEEAVIDVPQHVVDEVVAVEEAPETEFEQVFPEWTNETFKAMVFRVAGTRFAVPLVALNSITPVPEALTPIPAQPAWHKGVMKHRDGKLVAVDLGVLLNLDVKTEDAKFLLVLGDGTFALACDALENPITVEPEQIRFKSANDSSTWMIGMLPDQMCALLDLDQIENVIRHD